MRDIYAGNGSRQWCEIQYNGLKNGYQEWCEQDHAALNRLQNMLQLCNISQPPLIIILSKLLIGLSIKMLQIDAKIIAILPSFFSVLK